jgi:hypothetical protein
MILIISYPEIYCFQYCMNDAFARLNKWIKANQLTLNFYKTNCMKFCTNSKTCDNLNIRYDDKTIEEVQTTKFLGLQVDSNLHWKTYLLHCNKIPFIFLFCVQDWRDLGQANESVKLDAWFYCITEMKWGARGLFEYTVLASAPRDRKSMKYLWSAGNPAKIETEYRWVPSD